MVTVHGCRFTVHSFFNESSEALMIFILFNREL